MKPQPWLYILTLGIALAGQTAHSSETNTQPTAPSTNIDTNLLIRFEPRAVPPGPGEPKGNWGVGEGPIALSLSFDKAVFQEGESIPAIVAFRNTTDHSIGYTVPVAGAPLPQLLLTNEATGARIKGTPLQPFFGSAFLITLEPGWQNIYELRLDRYFNLAPGKYSVVAAGRPGPRPVLRPSGVAHITIVAKPPEEH